MIILAKTKQSFPTGYGSQRIRQRKLKNMSKRCQVPNSNVCAHKPRVIFTIEAVACFDCCDRENVHFNSRKAYVSDTLSVKKKSVESY